MTTAGMDVLLVGRDFHTAQTLPTRLRQWGFRCHFADTLRAASHLLNSHPVDLVLTETRLPDGSGFRLVGALSGLPVSAFLCLPVEDSCFWLPAIDCGRNCWGSPALQPAEFTRTLEELAQRGSLSPMEAC
jgi:response regulator RpfG family c-di-GMP phosphodiesterase